MTTLDKFIIVFSLIAFGWVLNEANQLHERKQKLPEIKHHIAACDAAFVNLTIEQITTLETCNTDTECRDLAISLGVPEECAE